MGVDDNGILIYMDSTVAHFADADTAHIFVIINGTDQYLGFSVRVALRRRNMLDNCFKKRLHILAVFAKLQHGNTGFRGGIDERTVKLFVGSVQIDQKLQHLVDDFIRACFRPVNFINADDNGQFQFQRFFQNKFCLRHRAFKSVDNEDNAVYHLEDTFNFTAEVGMSRRIDNINFCVLIKYGGVFG